MFFELELIDKFPAKIMAIDEAGRGPLAGPISIGLIEIHVQNQLELITFLKFLTSIGVGDSKKLTKLKRKKILQSLNISFDQFSRNCSESIGFNYFIEFVSILEIERLNIFQANYSGMKKLVSKNIKSIEPFSNYLLIDGPHSLDLKNHPSVSIEQIPLIKGDSRSLLIGLASILAKEFRDFEMLKMHLRYPQYGFNQHQGYPTKAHKKAIKEFGPSPIHRQSFKGVKEYLSGNY